MELITSNIEEPTSLFVIAQLLERSSAAHGYSHLIISICLAILKM